MIKSGGYKVIGLSVEGPKANDKITNVLLIPESGAAKAHFFHPPFLKVLCNVIYRYNVYEYG